MSWSFWDYVKVTLAASLAVAVIAAIKLLPLYLT